jgi:hypothetical protein
MNIHYNYITLHFTLDFLLHVIIDLEKGEMATDEKLLLVCMKNLMDSALEKIAQNCFCQDIIKQVHFCLNIGCHRMTVNGSEMTFLWFSDQEV